MQSPGYEWDVCVIGAGSAGYAAARVAAEAGLKTVVLDGSTELGGLCILRGCMPTKALLYSAEVLHLNKQALTFGIRNAGAEPDFQLIMARKNRLINEFAEYRRQQLRSGRFSFIHDFGKFEDPHTLALSGGKKLSAAHFIIGTGSVISPAPLDSLNDIGFITSDDALRLEKLPESLIVLGGGSVAVEFAQFFCRMGVKVTLIQRGAHLLRDEDADAAMEVEKTFRREGITVFTGTRLCEAWREGGLKWVSFEFGGQIVRAAGDDIFYALGRRPSIGGLELEKAGVKVEYGRFLTNSEMQTSVPHIYAAGDCTGMHEIVHIAVQQGEIAAHNIAFPERRRHMDYRLLTSVVFTDPQVARVGLTEKEAIDRKIPYLAAIYPFNDHGKSLIMEALDGFVKILADPASGAILGACCVGPVGGELIHELIVAMRKNMTVHELAATPHYHPTLAEIWTYPAEELAGKIKL